MSSSALSLSIANLDKFLVLIGKELGANHDTARCFLVMFLHSIFKVMSVAMLCVVYRTQNGNYNLYIVNGFMVFLAGSLSLLSRFYNLKDSKRQIVECWILSWLTVTNLDYSRPAKIFRLVSAYFWLIIYSCNLGFVAVVANKEDYQEYFGLQHWKDLPIVQNIFVLNIMISFTIGAGLLSLYLDLFLAWNGWCNIFHHQSR